MPVRLIKNKFVNDVEEAEKHGASKEELINLLGKGRAKLGMFEGDIHEGELEIGQISALIDEIKPVAEIIEEIITEFRESKEKLDYMDF